MTLTYFIASHFPKTFSISESLVNLCGGGFITNVRFKLNQSPKTKYILGEKNGLTMTFGEPLDVNPSGFENCSRLHSHIR